MKLERLQRALAHIWVLFSEKTEEFRRGLREEYWRLRLGSAGSALVVYGPLRIWNPQHVRVGSRCTINPGVELIARAESVITIEDEVVISSNVLITSVGLQFDKTGIPMKHDAQAITIKKGAWLAAGSIILPGVTVGERAVVAAGAVVAESVPPWTVVAGVPAKFVREVER